MFAICVKYDIWSSVLKSPKYQNKLFSKSSSIPQVTSSPAPAYKGALKWILFVVIGVVVQLGLKFKIKINGSAGGWLFVW